MSESNDIPDSIRPFLNEISTRLWAGRAAVMVGSGFSKNASPDFPDWNQLGDLFYKKAHGREPDSERQKYLNVLRLADEVQAAIGRPALEQLLRSTIPDKTVAPSVLHEELLKLPWVDVFTTNYDTLLERAATKSFARRYETVVNKEDIAYAAKPRIVKLHGSFPSERPFIITEEDYRRYPHDFAPFVNTVQQSLLENTLVLIGFSGDDPNFLQWIGWIRDNLGREKSQKIYLVGLFSLSAARQNLLANRGIIVVDLSCLNGNKKRSHRQAFEQLFAYITPAPAYPNWISVLEKLSPEATLESVQKAISVWRQERETYPGWLILPHNDREYLFFRTRDWIRCLSLIDQFTKEEDILFIRELLWRLEKCLMPVFESVAIICEKLLSIYWPFDSDCDDCECLFSFRNIKFQQFNWKAIRESWIAISLAMLRFYREEGKINEWETLEKRLLDDSVNCHISSEQQELLYYEKFLFNLFLLDIDNAKKCLNHWQAYSTHPYWMAKRAGALAELGLHAEAGELIKEALDNIRLSSVNSFVVSDTTIISMESYTMLLKKYLDSCVEQNMNMSRDDQLKYNDRWHELKRFRCDPIGEFNYLRQELEKPFDQSTSSFKQESTFDIGHWIQKFTSPLNHNEILVAYNFLRFCEEIGLPFRINNSNICTTSAIASAERIAKSSRYWAVATLIRTGEVQSADILYSREAVFKLSCNEINHSINKYINTLDSCRNDINNVAGKRTESYSKRLARILPEIISRMLCKGTTIQTKQRILNFITSIYSSNNRSIYQNTRLLLMRFISSMTDFDKINFTSDFLRFPFDLDEGHMHYEDFPNPVRYLDNILVKSNAGTDIISVDLINKLIACVQENTYQRKWAITTLFHLHKLSLISDYHAQIFCKALFGNVDKDGMPSQTEIYYFAFLELPSKEFKDSFRKYVENNPFPVQDANNNIDRNSNDIHLIRNIIGAYQIDNTFWTYSDVVKLLKRICDWWGRDKGLLKLPDTDYFFGSRLGIHRSRFLLMINMLANVICPKLRDTSSQAVLNLLKELIHELPAHDMPALVVEAASLHIFPDSRFALYNKIQQSLSSLDQRYVQDALDALDIILIEGDDKRRKSLSASKLLCDFLSWASAKAVLVGLIVVQNVVDRLRKSNGKLSEVFARLEKATLQRLERLLVEAAYDQVHSSMNFDERLHVRRTASSLASTLWAYYSNENKSIPDVIQAWADSCTHENEFAEVRNPWINRGYTVSS